MSAGEGKQSAKFSASPPFGPHLFWVWAPTLRGPHPSGPPPFGPPHPSGPPTLRAPPPPFGRPPFGRPPFGRPPFRPQPFKPPLSPSGFGSSPLWSPTIRTRTLFLDLGAHPFGSPAPWARTPWAPPTPSGPHPFKPRPLAPSPSGPLVPHPPGPPPASSVSKNQELAVAKVGLVVAKQGRGQTRSRPGARRVGGAGGLRAQNFALFFPSPAPIFVLFLSFWGSSRGILVVFEAPERSSVHVWSSRAVV